jgi:hypothetical protein
MFKILNSLPSTKAHHKYFEIGKAYEIVGTVGDGYIVKVDECEDGQQLSFIILQERFSDV